MLIAIGACTALVMLPVWLMSDPNAEIGRYPGTISFWGPAVLVIAAVVIIAGIVFTLRARRK